MICSFQIFDKPNILAKHLCWTQHCFVDGLALLDAKPYAGRVVTKFGCRLCILQPLEVLKRVMFCVVQLYDI